MKTRKLLKIGVLGLAMATILAGCSWFGPKNDKAAQDAVHTAMVNSSKVKAGTYDFQLTGKVSAGKDSKAQFKELTGSVVLGGVYDIKTKGDPRFTFKVDSKGSVDGAKEQSVGGEMRLAQKNMYFSVNKVEVDGIPDLYKATIAQFLNKWWFVALPAESFAKFDATTGDDKDMTPEQKQMKDLAEKTQFFKSVSDSGSDKVGSVDAEKYSVELDKEAFKTYLTEAQKISGSPASSSDMVEFDKLMKNVDFNGNVWVSKSDQTLIKVGGKVKLNPSADTDNTGMDFDITYTIVNGDVKVEVPANPEKFDLGKLLGLPEAPATPGVAAPATVKKK